MARSPIWLCGTRCRQTTPFSCPPGTIHAIGAGLVIAELQQRSDTTFRLFDHGRERELHIEKAIAVADAGPAEFQVQTGPAYRRTEASRFQPAFRVRTDRSHSEFLLVFGCGTRNLASRYRRQRSRRIVRGCHRRCPIRAIGPCRHSPWRHRHGGPRGVHGRRPCPTPAAASHAAGSIDVGRPREMQVPTSLTQAKAAPNNGHLETIK